MTAENLTEVPDIFTDAEQEAGGEGRGGVKIPTLTDKREWSGNGRGGGRAEGKERSDKPPARKTGSKVSLKIQESHTEGGVKVRRKK